MDVIAKTSSNYVKYPTNVITKKVQEVPDPSTGEAGQYLKVNDTKDGYALGVKVEDELNVTNQKLDESSLLSNFTYDGIDLKVKFATEIAAAPYNGDAWAWIKARIVTGNFAGINIQDYIDDTYGNGTKVRHKIKGINTYKGSGDDGHVVKNHIDFISAHAWPTTVTWNRQNYNNGLGCDKFTSVANQTDYQLTHRTTNAYPSGLASVTVAGAATTDYTYTASTGILHFNSAPTAGQIIKANWNEATTTAYHTVNPFKTSHIYAYINSLKMGVPNETVADPALYEVDYSTGGIYYYMPQNLKNVISNKRIYAESRYQAGTLLTNTSADVWTDFGPLWLPCEKEIYGVPVWSNSQRDGMYPHQYPGFINGNRRFAQNYENMDTLTNRAYVWLCEPISGHSSHACGVSGTGYASYYNTSSATIRPLVCFRIAA